MARAHEPTNEPVQQQTGETDTGPQQGDHPLTPHSSRPPNQAQQAFLDSGGKPTDKNPTIFRDWASI